ncbi:G1 family glutamic endopeptidase [Desertibaculum subflavum]|uniref:G1 family glutamic endopeptidase n=1 Tax=Desertibaculum subflavum TaxID=2268458 RepID=UPI000E662F85
MTEKTDRDGQKDRQEGGLEISGIRTNFPKNPFDAIAASEEQLKAHFLPPRPDRTATPVAYANWIRAMASTPLYPDGIGHRIVPLSEIAFLQRANRDTTQSSSRNWSGGMVRPHTFDGIALVQGSWTVPDTRAPAPGVRHASSYWVGLDGFEPASRVMPQIGAGQRIYAQSDRGLPGAIDKQTAWWQFWMPDHPKAIWQVDIPASSIRAQSGDRLYGQVQVIDRYTVSYFLKNETTNQAYAVYYDAAVDYSPPHLRPIERQTAEWIVERPGIPDPHQPNLPIEVALADYGETPFANCNAATYALDGTWREFQLQRAHLIRMNAWYDTDSPGRLVSQPKRIGHDGLLLTYVGPSGRICAA